MVPANNDPIRAIEKSKKQALQSFFRLLHWVPSVPRNIFFYILGIFLAIGLAIGVLNNYVQFFSWVVETFIAQKTISPMSKTNSSNTIPVPKNIDDGKVLQAMDSKCNTTNSFERSIWKTGSMQVVSRDDDTGEPIMYGAKQDEPYQSLMVFEFACELPLVATISAIIQSPQSIGLVFEYDGVLQILLGDGDKRSIRYKTHTMEARRYGWEYVYDKDDHKITQWIPDGVEQGSQIDLTIVMMPVGKGEIEIQVSLSYLHAVGEYTVETFPPVIVKAYNYNFQQNIGKYIRVGINDFLYKGNQSKISFLRFSSISGGKATIFLADRK